MLFDGNCYAPLGELITSLGGSLTSSADSHGPAAMLTLPGTAPFHVSLHTVAQFPPASHLLVDHLFLLKTDGSGVQQLSYEYDNSGDTGILASVSAPAFTEDGASLLYLAGKDIVMRSLHSPEENVLTAAFTREGLTNVMPHLLPDGTLYFVQLLHAQDPQICRMHLDGNGFHSLGAGIFPHFSADERKIAYTGISKKGELEVHIMNADGSKDRLLAPGFLNALSADGTIVASTKLVPAKGVGYEIGNVVGNNVNTGATLWQMPAPAHKGFDFLHLFSLDFSPDGRHLVYADSGGLLLTDAEGKNQRTDFAWQ